MGPVSTPILVLSMHMRLTPEHRTQAVGEHDEIRMGLQEVVAKRQPAQKLPVFVGGQSMGGMTAVLCGIRSPHLYQVLLAFFSL